MEKYEKAVAAKSIGLVDNENVLMDFHVGFQMILPEEFLQAQTAFERSFRMQSHVTAKNPIRFESLLADFALNKIGIH